MQEGMQQQHAADGDRCVIGGRINEGEGKMLEIPGQSAQDEDVCGKTHADFTKPRSRLKGGSHDMGEGVENVAKGASLK